MSHIEITSEAVVKRLIAAGESSKVEFKEDSARNERLAAEICAFANFKGGILLLGVSDTGEIPGVSRSDNEERIMNICSNLIEPRLIPEYETVICDDKKLAVIKIDLGKEKPYAVFVNGKRTYYIRVGSTTRVSTQRELLRMFQDSSLIHFEVLSTQADFGDLN